MSAALRGAALKREKKAAAAAARAAGKVAAAARRAEDHTARDKAFAEEAALIDRQIVCARRALGVCLLPCGHPLYPPSCVGLPRARY
jgi:hypothetical protein